MKFFSKYHQRGKFFYSLDYMGKIQERRHFWNGFTWHSFLFAYFRQKNIKTGFFIFLLLGKEWNMCFFFWKWQVAFCSWVISCGIAYFANNQNIIFAWRTYEKCTYEAKIREIFIFRFSKVHHTKQVAFSSKKVILCNSVDFLWNYRFLKLFETKKSKFHDILLHKCTFYSEEPCIIFESMFWNTDTSFKKLNNFLWKTELFH